MNRGRQLRELMSKGECVIAPGAYDGLTARLIAQAGFASVYMTGGGTSSGFGYPDYGLLTMSEMVENAGRIVDAVDLPVISDADNGYGNELNVYRTIQTFEKAGVAGSISRIKYSQKMWPSRRQGIGLPRRLSRKDQSGGRCTAERRFCYNCPDRRACVPRLRRSGPPVPGSIAGRRRRCLPGSAPNNRRSKRRTS